MQPIPHWMRDLGNTADGLYITDSRQRITFWNKGAERLFGHTEAEAVGKRCYDVIAGRTQAGKAWCHSDCPVQRAVRRNEAKGHYSLLIRGNCGREICANISVIVLGRRGGRQVVHLASDITRMERDRVALQEVLEALRKAGHAGTEIPAGSPPADPAHRPEKSVMRLTGREVEILSLVAVGMSTAAIAKRLGVSPYTVRNHIQKSLGKLGLHTQAQAVSYVYKNGLIGRERLGGEPA